MWKVLGDETIMINADAVWTKRLLELSQRRKDAPKFKELLSRAKIRYYFDTIREVHMFYLQFPPDVSVEDLEFMKEFILKLHKAAKVPVVEFEGEAQRSSIVFSADQPVDDHKKRNNWWEMGEEKEEQQSI
jgi:glycosyltransferase involved in cell wall biosynthesis